MSVHKATTHDLPRARLTQQAHTLPPILITQQTISNCMQIHILCRPFANDGSLKTEGGGGDGGVDGKICACEHHFSHRRKVDFQTDAHISYKYGIHVT